MNSKTEVFEVSTNPLENEERVYIIGNCPQLGDWNYKEAIECTLQNVTLSEQLWTATVSLPCDEEIKYRYFIATPETLTGGKVIKLWEICIQPRSTILSSISNGIGNHAPDRFGYIGNSYEVDKGWLTSHSVLQLKLFDDPVKLWNNQYHETTYSFKLSAVDLHNRNKTTNGKNDAHNSSAIKVTAISDELKVCKQQKEYGHVYKTGDFVIYEAQVLQNTNMAYRIDFYAHGDATPDHIGYSYILQDNIKSEAGNITTVIISNDNIPQGQVTMEYVCVSPVAGNLCDMSVSYVKYWKETWTGLDVGHRGSGKVKALPLEERRYRENTVESLSNAGNKGADLVEFDVQLSKDDVPIIFHDFHFNVTVKKHDNQCDTNINVPLHEFTHSELNSVKVHDNNDYCDSNVDNQMLFPTLESLLQTLDEKLGFNIELKIPVPHKNDKVDKSSTVKLNKYVDIILKVIFENTDTRKIVFSSFHPDICTMVRLKQNKYPVLFLTQGITDRYDMLRDPRGHSTSQAILNAQAADLLGVCAHSQELLENTELIARCTKTAGLILFCWGNDLNQKNNITQLKELGVHGVIFDRIDEFVEKKSSAFREDVLPSHKSVDKT